MVTGHDNRQKWSNAQRLTSDTPVASVARNSSGHGHPPLNIGIRYAVSASGHVSGAVIGNAMACFASVRLRSVDPNANDSIFMRFSPDPDNVCHCEGRFT